jgi:hypothetical protein
MGGAQADVIGRDELRFSVQGEIRPNVPHASAAIIRGARARLLADETPHFINLNPIAWQVLHPLIQQSRAAIPHGNTQAHDGIPMGAEHALNPPNGIALGEGRNDCRLLFERKNVAHIVDFLCHRNYVPSTTICGTKTFSSMKSPKIGRPKLPKGEAKSAMIRARVTPAEQKAIEKAANGAGVSEWARNVLLRAAGFTDSSPFSP